jgi:peptidoglycan hydrolase-like protein with peptidoglycan-binding domain
MGASGTLMRMPSPRRRRVAARLLGPLLLALSILPWLGAGGVAAAPLYPNQSQGNRGADVKAIQGLLRHHGDGPVVDGIYGASTTSAVLAFQASHGLTADGQVGETTWVKLVVRVETGSTGEAVKALQRQLNEKRRAGLTVDGLYGAATRRAVSAFQGHVHLSQNGIAGPLTWRYLIAHFQRPVFGGKLCDYQVGNGLADWGTGAAIGQLRAAAVRVVGLGRGRVAVGDIGFEHGGDIPGHESHEHGLDVDVRPMRRDEAQCTSRTNYRSSSYSRAATRDLIKAIRAAAPGHVRLIYFNDPVLIREGLTTWHTGHDDHLHIRYCEKVHPVAAYRC